MPVSQVVEPELPHEVLDFSGDPAGGEQVEPAVLQDGFVHGFGVRQIKSVEFRDWKVFFKAKYNPFFKSFF